MVQVHDTITLTRTVVGNVWMQSGYLHYPCSRQPLPHFGEAIITEYSLSAQQPLSLGSYIPLWAMGSNINLSCTFSPKFSFLCRYTPPLTSRTCQEHLFYHFS